MVLKSVVIDTSFGKLALSFTAQGLSAISFVDTESEVSEPLPPAARQVQQQLEEFFAGSRTSFDIVIDFSAMPQFQADVLKLVRSIPYGKTRSYEQIAIHLGNAKAARAVGQANGNNPIPIVIPCHRVIGKGGKLTGYAYGLDVKKKLLRIENPAAYRPQIELFSA
ncbi:MAG: methylated-DNA--[protein]-cysteine S-methyltransferase [Saprospiraceae bacterium]|nr:methylated-DNA--[protein]-cysteine S-methyltransferase [Saprospiraceae bacterium]